MLSAVSAVALGLAIAIAGSGFPVSAQKTPQTAPPTAVVKAVTGAKTVFVVNGGTDNSFLNVIPGDANTCYNEFFTSLAGSGRFTMLKDPATADLLLVIRCSQDVDYERSASKYRLWDEIDGAPLVSLAVFTPAAKQPLYAITQPAGRASNIPKGKVAFAISINGITAKLLALSSSSPQLPSADTLMTGTGTVPAKIPTAKRLYVALDSQNSSADPTSMIAPFSAALKASGRYVLTPTVQDADLTLNVAFDSVMVIRICDPATQQLLWTLSDPTRNMDPKGNKGHLQREVDGVAAAFEALGKIQ
jgi:hypothetical protein